MPERLVTEFSTRARHIDAETGRLIENYTAEHGRRPPPATIMKLRAQATLSTRPEKKVRSLAALTSEWRQRAGQVLGADATSWARRVSANEEPLLLRADDVSLDVIASLGQDVVASVGEKRSTWHRWNLTAEAARQTMGYRFATTEDREAIARRPSAATCTRRGPRPLRRADSPRGHPVDHLPARPARPR